MKKLFTLTIMILGGMGLTACEPATSPTTPTTTPTATIAPSPTALPRAAVNTSTIENKDGSTTVVTTYNDGTKSEVRTFKTGKLARVTRTTDASGARTVHASFRADDTEVEIKDESWIEKSMDATGNALAVAADKTKAAAIETADKAEDVGDATKKGVKKAASETADKAEDVGDAVKKGAKKTAKKVKDVIKP